MSRTSARPRPVREQVLIPVRRHCPACGGIAQIRYENYRTLVLLSGPVRLRLKIRRCEHAGCERLRVPYRPEAEGALALAQHEFGLDVIALVGTLRHRDHRSIPEIHAHLRARGVEIAERSVTNLLKPLRRVACHIADQQQPAAPGAGQTGTGRAGTGWHAAGRGSRGAVGHT